MYDLSVLLHKIARWVVPFLTVPPEVKQRADAGLLTPADCRLIADKLDALGRSLASQDDVEKASRMAEEAIRLIRLAEEDDELRECLQNLHKLSEKQPRQTSVQFLLSLASCRSTFH